MASSRPWCVCVLLVATLLTLQGCYSAALSRSLDPRAGDELLLAPKKRPFCNAFTGCGRKRSPTPIFAPQDFIRQRQYIEEEPLVNVLESDNAVDELSRQVLAEARLWEALQDARRRQSELAASGQ